MRLLWILPVVPPVGFHQKAPGLATQPRVATRRNGFAARRIWGRRRRLGGSFLQRLAVLLHLAVVSSLAAVGSRFGRFFLKGNHRGRLFVCFIGGGGPQNGDFPFGFPLNPSRNGVTLKNSHTHKEIGQFAQQTKKKCGLEWFPVPGA